MEEIGVLGDCVEAGTDVVAGDGADVDGVDCY